MAGRKTGARKAKIGDKHNRTEGMHQDGRDDQAKLNQDTQLPEQKKVKCQIKGKKTTGKLNKTHGAEALAAVSFEEDGNAVDMEADGMESEFLSEDNFSDVEPDGKDKEESSSQSHSQQEPASGSGGRSRRDRFSRERSHTASPEPDAPSGDCNERRRRSRRSRSQLSPRRDGDMEEDFNHPVRYHHRRASSAESDSEAEERMVYKEKRRKQCKKDREDIRALRNEISSVNESFAKLQEMDPRLLTHRGMIERNHSRDHLMVRISTQTLSKLFVVRTLLRLFIDRQ